MCITGVTHPQQWTTVDRGYEQRAGRVEWVNTFVKDDRRIAARVYKTWFRDSSTNKKKKQEAELEAADFYWERSEWISSEYMRGTFPAEWFGEREASLKWFRHVQRTNSTCIAQKMLNIELPGRRKTTEKSQLCSDGEHAEGWDRVRRRKAICCSNP